MCLEVLVGGFCHFSNRVNLFPSLYSKLSLLALQTKVVLIFSLNSQKENTLHFCTCLKCWGAVNTHISCLPVCHGQLIHFNSTCQIKRNTFANRLLHTQLLKTSPSTIPSSDSVGSSYLNWMCVTSRPCLFPPLAQTATSWQMEAAHRIMFCFSLDENDLKSDI